MTQPASKSRIALGADHAGYEIKERIHKHLLAEGYPVDDQGTWSSESVDYPDIAVAVARRVADSSSDLGILVCGTGIGMAIAANKIGGVRAAVAHSAMTARMAREHNDANVLTVGARVAGEAEILDMVREFLATPFAGGRHQRRVDKMSELDQVRAAKS